MIRGNQNSAITSGAPDLKVLDGIASWCGGLHGSMALNEALGALANGFGAAAAAISRNRESEDRSRIAAIFDENSDAEAPELRRAFSHDVLGSYYAQAEVGSVWFLHERKDDPDWVESQTLNNWCQVREIEEIIVVSLSRVHQQRDFVEFHMGKALGRSDILEFKAIAPTIVRSWAGRKPGLVTQSQMDDRMVRARASAKANKMKWNAPILGMSNPAKLSRAEFRVCLLLSRGLSVQGIMEELRLTESTIRSHLRSIYSKTETSGHSELFYRILSSGTEPVEAASFAAH